MPDFKITLRPDYNISGDIDFSDVSPMKQSSLPFQAASINPFKPEDADKRGKALNTTEANEVDEEGQLLEYAARFIDAHTFAHADMDELLYLGKHAGHADGRCPCPLVKPYAEKLMNKYKEIVNGYQEYAT